MSELRAHILQLHEYNDWANTRILEAAEGISTEQFLASTKFPYDSLRATLTHILFAEWVWRRRLMGKPPKASDKLIGPEDFPEVGSLRAAWARERSAMLAYLQGLDEETLAGSFAYTTIKGIRYEQGVAEVLIHVVLHGMQHRSEAAQMLTEFGHSPGDIDYVIWLRTR